MGLGNLIKREIGITIATVLLVTIVFLMFSYSIFKVEVSGDTNAITFGDISMSFCADKTCNSTLDNIGNVIGTEKYTNSDGEEATKYVPIYPQKDPATTEEWNALKPYTFTLTNDGKLDLYISLLLTKDPSTDLKYSVDDQNFTAPVADDQIKIAIGESGSTPTIKLYSETKNEKGEYIIANNILIAPGETKIFNLYAWLKTATDTEEGASNESQGKYFVTQISARGEFIPENPSTSETETTEQTN